MMLALTLSIVVGITLTSIPSFAGVPESLLKVSSSKTTSKKGTVKNSSKEKNTKTSETTSNTSSKKGAQSDSASSSNREVYQDIEEQPEFPGGIGALMKYLAASIEYPEKAQKNEVQGRVIVKFIIESDGSISNASILHGISPELDEEALRIVNKMPKWTPGKNNGVAVASNFTLPVYFRLPTQ